MFDFVDFLHYAFVILDERANISHSFSLKKNETRLSVPVCLPACMCVCMSASVNVQKLMEIVEIIAQVAYWTDTKITDNRGYRTFHRKWDFFLYPSSSSSATHSTSPLPASSPLYWWKNFIYVFLKGVSCFIRSLSLAILLLLLLLSSFHAKIQWTLLCIVYASVCAFVWDVYEKPSNE